MANGGRQAANVLVDENGRCVLSDVGQHEIKTEAHRSCGRPDHREWPMLLSCLRKFTSSLQASRNGSRQRFSKATIDQQ